MSESRRFTFKIADEPWEMESIHRLNHRTFAEEIPQHDATGDGRLVDRFHDDNVYVVCTVEQELAGMVALRLKRPFSIEQKLEDVASLVPPGRQWCEVRLLAVEKPFRGTAVATGLLRKVIETGTARGCNGALISATTRQAKLYRHLGCVPFGPLVGREGAWYQPMYLLREDLEKAAPRKVSEALQVVSPPAPVNFLPGPVAVPEAVREAFGRPPVSHRVEAFLDDVQVVRERLHAMTGAAYAALLPGSGTLANEAVCSQIGLLDSPGMVVSIGEFGERLADHARRAWLPHEHLCLPWGHALEVPKLAALLDRHPEVRWIWTTHCETSTGALTDLPALLDVCEARGILLALDCISSLGCVPADLSRVWMAAGTSGKGLGSYAGVALVMHRDPVDPSPDKIPRYLDLGLYAQGGGVPFTVCTPLVCALKTALEQTDWGAKHERIRRLHGLIRAHLPPAGWQIVMEDGVTSPAVITLALPPDRSSVAFAEEMEKDGYWLGACSAYLRQRNWVQICLMGDLHDTEVEAFVRAFRRQAGPPAAEAPPASA